MRAWERSQKASRGIRIKARPTEGRLAPRLGRWQGAQRPHGQALGAGVSVMCGAESLLRPPSVALILYTPR